LITLIHVVDEWCSHTCFCRFFPTLGIIDVTNIPGSDVFANRKLVTTEILKNDTDTLAQGVDVPALQIQPIQQYPSRRRIVQSS